jgi:hypothetical protein
MATNPTFQRYIPKLDDPQADQAFQLAFKGLKDLNDAIAAIHSRTTNAETNITTITQQVSSGTSTGGTTLPVNVNQQVADYALQNSDFGGLVVFSDAGPYTLTLNPGVTRPFYSSILNLSAADLTVVPGTIPDGTASVINGGLTTVTIPVNFWSVIFFDGLNWWMLLLPVSSMSFTPIAHEFLTGYDSATGAFSAAQPAYGDISGTPQLAQTLALVAHKFFTSYDAVTGLFVAAQPAEADIVHASGNTASRPVSVDVGFPYFDTDLGFPIWWKGAVWVDASGATV